MGTFKGERPDLDEACGLAWTDTTLTTLVGPAYTDNNCSLGIGQNNSGAYCSIRMGSCNCYNDSCQTTWADDEGVATPCSFLEWEQVVMRLWAR